MPSLMVLGGILLPLLVLLIIWFVPKQSLSSNSQPAQTLPTDAFRIRTGIFSALIFLVCILVSFFMCVGKMTTLTGTRVDSEQSDINNAKRLRNIQQQVKNEIMKAEQQEPEREQNRLLGEESPMKEVIDMEEGLHRVDNSLNRNSGFISRDQDIHNAQF